MRQLTQVYGCPLKEVANLLGPHYSTVSFTPPKGRPRLTNAKNEDLTLNTSQYLSLQLLRLEQEV